jgi:hypothetical protein
MTLKLIFSDAIRFYRDNLRQIAAICFPFLLVDAIIDHLVLSRITPDTDPGSAVLLPLVLNFAIFPIYTVALILMMSRRAQRERPGSFQLISDALGLYFPFLLLLMISMGLIWCGLLMFVVPGLWIFIRLVFAQFFLVVDRMDPREALIKSFQATRNRFFPILAAIALCLGPVIIIGWAIMRAIVATQAGAFTYVLADAILSFLVLFMYVVLFRMFMEVTREERLSLP